MNYAKRRNVPQTTSAKKALRQNKKRRARNKTYKNRIKKLSRQISDLVKENKQKEAVELLPGYYKAVDKATRRNILHKNTAARRKSVITRRIKNFELRIKNGNLE
jgi:small subunit ribosomal protein S20